jgi:acyl transferase domain-containing protein/thioesterase domain-containing protein
MSDPIHPTDIAIIGIAAHLPGARDFREYWKNLRDGVESVREFTKDELLAAGVTEAQLRNPGYVKSGVVLEGLEHFDPDFFGFSPKEAAILDPQHRHFLECAWEALEDAGHPPESFDGAIGVFGGCGMGAYFAFNLLSNPRLVDSVGLFLLRHTGNDKDFLCTRVSYNLDLRGPSVNVQTACSTSLVAVHVACQNLLSGECDMALAGGVTIELPHRRGYLFQEGEILSPDGHCRAFDERSQGTIFGSGAGIVVLRRLSDAIEDNDHVYAVIRGSAINNDGSGKVGYLAPSVDGQAAAVTEALSVADVRSDTIQYIECHGTGTPMGDPIEISALTQAFQKTSDAPDATAVCAIGSVKTNIGHLDTAAGVAGLIKVALALQHRQIPPSLNYKTPNPNIEFEKTPFFVNSRLTDWIRGESPRRAAVNSLGVGGTNAHVIVEEAPQEMAPARASRPYQLLTLSAKNRAALDGASKRLAQHLREHPEQSLADVAWTLRHGRRAFGERRVLAAATAEEAAALLDALDTRRVFTHSAPSGKTSTVFMFPGGGAQHPRMGRDLYAAEPVYREHIDRGLAELLKRTKKDLRPLLFADDARLGEVAVELERPSLQLPAIFIVEHALAKLWMSWGVEPSAMIGHSMGENTAACLAGVMSFTDTLGLVSLRGDLFERVPPGGMLSVPLSAEELRPLLGAELDLASVNSTGLCVASGPVDALERLARQLEERGVETKRVPISIAAHSRLLDPILADFGAYLKSIRLSPPKLPFVSNFTGTWITDREAQDPEYWVRHLRNTIRFADGIGTLCADKSRVFLEVGPGKTLSSLARQHADLHAGASCLSSLRHPDERISDVAFFTAVLGRLWGAGVAVDLAQLWKGEKRRRVSLPTYAFQRQRYWIEPGAPATASVESKGSPEKLASFDDWFHRPVWNERPLETSSAPPAKETWLVFVDDAGIGERVVAWLAARGHDVVTVHESDSYEQHSPSEYFLSPEHGREGYDRLVRDLVASGKVPSGVAHLWMVTGDESFRPGSSFFHRNQERGFYSLFFLAQATLDEGLPGPLRVHVVSNGMQSVDGETLCYPDKATLLGPCKVWPHEAAGTTVSSIDVELPGQGGARKPRFSRFSGKKILDELARSVAAELAAPAANAIVAWRDGERFVQELEAWKRSAAPAIESRLRERGVYVITGGLGGLGLVAAQFLATRYRARLVLIGRTALPPRSEWDAWMARSAFSNATSRRIQRVRDLELAGAEVMIAAADITDSVAMRAVLRDARSRFGSIDGVFHTAGVLDDGLIQGKTQSSVEDVFTPKVHGTLVLDALLAEEKPAFLVLYSSTSAWIAPAGQVDYVAANAFLDAYAQSKSSSGETYTVAVDWGVWNEVGMGFDAASRMGHTGASATQRETRVRHPFFDARVEDRSSHIVLTARFTPSARWVLDEHRTRQGHALLPGSGYFELIGAALRECGETSAFEVRDLYFFRPMYVADTETKELRVRLRASDEGYAFDLQTKVDLDGGRAGYQTHAQARVLLHTMATPEPVDLAAIDARCDIARLSDPGRGVRTKQEDHLRFGPRWRVVESAHYGRGEALASLALPSAFHADVESIALHPALIDLATGFAMNLIDGYQASNDLWVPVSYKSARIHGRLPARIHSWVRNHTANSAGGAFATFDVTITDPHGRVLVEVEEFAIKRLAHGEGFAVAPKPSERELEFDDPHGMGGALSRSLSPAELAFQENVERGILPSEGQHALERILSGHAEPQIVVSSLDLAALASQSRELAATITPEGDGAKFARPDLASEYVAARDDVEKTLVGFFEELLGVQSVGVKDSFFDLGGHSLVAVRLFSKIKKAWQVEYPISVLFEAPTIEGCAEMIRTSIGEARADAADPAIASAPSTAPRSRYAHLVKMHPGEGTRKTPFFLVAGMFGNVLNLRHVAQLVGADRPFYGLQARGLYGDHKPHETFEEMAEAYLAELLTIQPQGPYLLGGFSGGGITAFEMARQLRARGQEVSMLLMLDTPLPKSEPLTARDKAMIHWQRLKRSGHNYIFDWAKGRFRWELAKIQRKLSDAPADASASRASEFRSESIETAFRHALTLYDIRHYPGTLTLFRPKLDETHVLGPGRVANKVRELVFHDNGWSAHCQRVDVVEMPGDHDSMVLEPNVRVLAARLRERIHDVEERRESTRLAS